jgi:phospholipase C
VIGKARKTLTVEFRIAVMACVATLTACQSSTVVPAPVAPPLRSPVESTASYQILHAIGLLGKFKHVVIVVQENRSPDNLFNGLPGADTVRSGLNSHGRKVPLTAVSLSAPYDVQHSHPAFVTEYDGGKMDGFDIVRSNCSGNCPPAKTRVYAYVDPSETTPYFTMAEQYAFADRMFQSNQGPSFPAHLYVVSGSSQSAVGSTLKLSENPIRPQGGHSAGCNAPLGTQGQLIDANGNESHWMYPCIDVPTIFDLLAKNGFTWRYYQAHGGPGLWNAVDAIDHLRKDPHYRTNVVYPPSQFLRDAAAGKLASV